MGVFRTDGLPDALNIDQRNNLCFGMSRQQFNNIGAAKSASADDSNSNHSKLLYVCSCISGCRSFPKRPQTSPNSIVPRSAWQTMVFEDKARHDGMRRVVEDQAHTLAVRIAKGQLSSF